MNSLREAYTNQKRSFSHGKNKEGAGGGMPVSLSYCGAGIYIIVQ